MSNEQARDCVLGVLAGEGIEAVRFCLDGTWVTPGRLAEVREAITQGRIRVTHEDDAEASASYYAGANVITLRFVEADTLPRRASIVHECVHAACDIRRLPLTVLDSESAAYLAQCVYARTQAGPEDGRLNVSGSREYDRRRDAAFAAAWELAGRIAAGRIFLDDADLGPLRAAIRNHPWYRASHGSGAEYDGIRALPIATRRVSPMVRAPTAPEESGFRPPTMAGPRPTMNRSSPPGP